MLYYIDSKNVINFVLSGFSLKLGECRDARNCRSVVFHRAYDTQLLGISALRRVLPRWESCHSR